MISKTKKKTIKKRVVNPVQAEAAMAKKRLDKIESALKPDTDVTSEELHTAALQKRVPLAAIEVAARIMRANPQSFHDFDPLGADEAVVYETAMSEVSARARKLADNVDASILKRRKGAVDQTLALYASLKGVARMRGALRTDVLELQALVATHVGQRDVTRAEAATERAAVASAKAAAAATRAENAAAKAKAAAAKAAVDAGIASANGTSSSATTTNAAPAGGAAATA